jgi:beta-phosphoglucomutase family hydrolase
MNMVKRRTVFKISKRLFDAVIFDMDGVVTQTAKTHAAVWKQMFDEYLQKLGSSDNGQYRPFAIETDYFRYVDGKPRYEGIQSFLESRGIHLPPWGNPKDPPDRNTICGLGNRKNLLFNDYIKEHGVEVYQSTIDLIHSLKSLSFRTAVVTSSKNCNTVLEAAGIRHLFDTKVDGLDAERLELGGKPQPDIFIHAARNLDVYPMRAVVVEDAIAGVRAAKQGCFGCIIGVDRDDQADALGDSGADVTVKDLSEISVE